MITVPPRSAYVLRTDFSYGASPVLYTRQNTTTTTAIMQSNATPRQVLRWYFAREIT